jgi:hypothetical protein
MHASLVHDALYQYLVNIPLSKIEVEQLFHDILLEAGMPKLFARDFHLSVQKLGASDVHQDDASVNSDFTCRNFKHL